MRDVLYSLAIIAVSVFAVLGVYLGIRRDKREHERRKAEGELFMDKSKGLMEVLGERLDSIKLDFKYYVILPSPGTQSAYEGNSNRLPCGVYLSVKPDLANNFRFEIVWSEAPAKNELERYVNTYLYPSLYNKFVTKDLFPTRVSLSEIEKFGVEKFAQKVVDSLVLYDVIWKECRRDLYPSLINAATWKIQSENRFNTLLDTASWTFQSELEKRSPSKDGAA